MAGYADLVCDGCGAIYPANEMVHTVEELGSESYISNGYLTHRGGGQTVYSTVQTKVVLCKACAEARKPEPPSKLTGVLLKTASLVVGGVVLAPLILLGLMVFGRADQTTPHQPAIAQPPPRPEQSAPLGSDAKDDPSPRPIAATAADSRPAAPSFDCAKASSEAERLVCSIPDLARADVKLMDAYRRRMALLSPQSPEAVALRQQQRNWLTEERNRCATADCVAAAYASRTQALNQPIGER